MSSFFRFRVLQKKKNTRTTSPREANRSCVQVVRIHCYLQHKLNRTKSKTKIKWAIFFFFASWRSVPLYLCLFKSAITWNRSFIWIFDRVEVMPTQFRFWCELNLIITLLTILIIAIELCWAHTVYLIRMVDFNRTFDGYREFCEIATLQPFNMHDVWCTCISRDIMGPGGWRVNASKMYARKQFDSSILINRFILCCY